MQRWRNKPSPLSRSSDPGEISTDTVFILMFFFKRSYREQKDVQQKKMKYISRKWERRKGKAMMDSYNRGRQIHKINTMKAHMCLLRIHQEFGSKFFGKLCKRRNTMHRFHQIKAINCSGNIANPDIRSNRKTLKDPSNATLLITWRASSIISLQQRSRSISHSTTQCVLMAYPQSPVQ